MRVNQKDLAGRLAEVWGIKEAEASKGIKDVFEMVNAYLDVPGDEVALRGFGTFRVVERKARRGRNPKTGAEIDIPASTTIRFKPSSVKEAK